MNNLNGIFKKIYEDDGSFSLVDPKVMNKI